MNAQDGARRNTPAVLLGTVAALLTLPSPAATADGSAWTAQITTSGDLVITGSPLLDTDRAWAPGDSSRTSLTVRNDFDKTVTVSLAAQVDGPEAAQEALVITAGDGSALSPGGRELATLPVGGTARVPVEVALPLSSGNASQSQAASIIFTVHASETVGQDDGPGEPTGQSIPPTQAPPHGGDRGAPGTPSTGDGGAHRPGPLTLARTGVDVTLWWVLTAVSLIGLGLITMGAVARSRAGQKS